MDLSHPIRAVVPSLDGPVLEVLARTTQPLTGAQVHSLAGTGSVAGVRKVLARLADQGLVTIGEAGGAALLYTLNRLHLAAPAVEILTKLRSTLRAHLSDEVMSWTIRPVHASIFGSAARGDGDTQSDIDLLIVRDDAVEADDPTWRDQVDGLSEKAMAWTGNHAQIYEIDHAGLGLHVAAGERIVEDWRRDGVVLDGPELGQLFSRFEPRGGR